MADAGYALELSAVIVAVSGGRPRVLTVAGGDALPSGPFEPGHRTLELGVRDWVETATHHPLGYVEQLYTFADRDRTIHDRAGGGAALRTIALSYLALTREDDVREGEVGEVGEGEGWRDWYGYFPWEDRRADAGRPEDEASAFADVAARLEGWAEAGGAEAAARRQRAQLLFGLGGAPWFEEAVLQRYELLYEAGLIPEASRARPPCAAPPAPLAAPGRAMIHDHRRILATGLSRLRAKIKYRPVVFELMAPTFTLLHLQQAVEALAGRRLHKQNFRRLVEAQGLVEETGELLHGAGGRPARLVRFRRDVLAQRAVAGTRLALSRAG